VPARWHQSKGKGPTDGPFFIGFVGKRTHDAPRADGRYRAGHEQLRSESELLVNVTKADDLVCELEIAPVMHILGCYIAMIVAGLLYC